MVVVEVVMVVVCIVYGTVTLTSTTFASNSAGTLVVVCL